VPARAGVVTGRITLIEKGGRAASDGSSVVVWLEGPRGRVRPVRVSMVMKGKRFRPHLVVVGVGSTVEFPNEDPIFHNAFSVSGENRFDLDLYKRPRTGTWTFQHPGVVRVYCNIHPQMSAVVVVRDNPHFTRAGDDGTFTLEGVPPGRHVLKAWHERGGEATSEVTVPAEGAVTAALTLDGSRFRRVPHRNKHGKDYSTSDPY
jgi:plastocyanin